MRGVLPCGTVDDVVTGEHTKGRRAPGGQAAFACLLWHGDDVLELQVEVRHRLRVDVRDGLDELAEDRTRDRLAQPRWWLKVWRHRLCERQPPH